jgi:hypothetical protein
MAVANAVLQSRSVSQGHIIEVDLQLDDGTQSTLKIRFQQIQFLLRASWSAAAAAETTQRQAAGERMMAIVAPYKMTNMRTGHSLEGTILADFVTAQGPVQIAMTTDQARLTIERLTAELAIVDGQQFQRPS